MEKTSGEAFYPRHARRGRHACSEVSGIRLSSGSSVGILQCPMLIAPTAIYCVVGCMHPGPVLVLLWRFVLKVCFVVLQPTYGLCSPERTKCCKERPTKVRQHCRLCFCPQLVQ